MRARPPPQARGGDDPHRVDQPRRHPPPAAAGHGPVPGRLLHLPGGRDPARPRQAERRAGQPVAAGLPPGAVEGSMAGPLRRPAAPGPPRRLDLPGCPRRGASGRMRRSELHFDAVVIGAGTAGLVAATRLAQDGARGCVLAKGVGSTHLAPATIDVLGYAPDRVGAPGPALEQLIAARPDHPYALLGSGIVGDALSWFAEMVPRGPLPGYVYGGSLEHNQLLPTAVGALRPSALVPETMANGEASGLRRVCIVGTPALRDFHPNLCAANLARAGIEARSVSIELKLERADTNALGVARRFDDEKWRRQFCAELSLTLRAEEAVGLPAMLGLRDPHEVLADVEHRLGRRVFEIPTLPPSVPGMRLYEILRSALRAAGGRLVMGAEVTSFDRDGDRITSGSTH